MRESLDIVEVNGSQAAKLSLPDEWGCEDIVLVSGNSERRASLAGMIADTTKRYCPNGETCGARGSAVNIGSKIVEASLLCQIESCPIEQ